jgi:hypothetical protein
MVIMGSQTQQNRLVAVKVAPEWGTDPLWVSTTEEPFRTNLAPEWLVNEFDVPEDIVREIRQWDSEFQAVYLAWDPAASGFPDEVTTRRWHDRGLQLARRLAEILGPEVHVDYHTAVGDVAISEGTAGTS